MTTEQYSIGYDEGYQAGWNAAMDAKPAQRKPLTYEEIEAIGRGISAEDYGIFAIARAIEAAHGIKEKRND